ncbi:MAG: GntR family transcriptional regulator [Micropruina sp.]|uniref:GntR family transcriptional regulator n=1 Tax=Micropruina sp. TaxID=2737536 RepID=UPI0039E429A6
MPTASASRPMYEVIEEWLVEQCETLGPGGNLPSEVAVAERFGASRMTARRAFQNLAEKGLIERHRRIGSRVRPAPLHRQDSVLRPLTDEMRRRGLTPTSRLIHAGLGPNPLAAQQLGLPATEWVLTIQRLRFADGTPVALETACLPNDFADVLEEDLEQGSLHAALAHLGRTPARATGHVTARLATDEEADLLELDPPAALLVESRLIVDSTGRRVESTQSAYVGSRWVLDTGAYGAPSSLTSPA